MTNAQLQRESFFSANLDTVPQKEATTLVDTEWAQKLPRRIAPHLIARKILGEGGTAIVFGAFHTRLKLSVAVKILKLEGESSAEAALRMHREAELCARLDSARFPRIYDVDTLPDGTPYVVMEEVHGRPLDELLSHGPLEFDLAVAIVCEVLEGLSELHAAGVIHRDIKPSNLILEEDDSGSFRVRMLDLGIAKTMDDPSLPDPLGSNPALSLTQRGCLLGTPHYMSTEQLMGAPVDLRTDLYSVGVLLYETLSGRLPFQGETAGGVIAAALRDAPVALRVLRPDLPEELEYIVTKAMERDRSQRFSSAAEMLVALRGLSPQRLNARCEPRSFASSLENFDDLPASPLGRADSEHRVDSGLRLTDSPQAWAARALHSMPPESPRLRRLWPARGLLAVCAVLAGIVAWPTVTGRPERSLRGERELGATASDLGPAPFVPALTQPPRPESSRVFEHIELLQGQLKMGALDLRVPDFNPAREPTTSPAASTPSASPMRVNTPVDAAAHPQPARALREPAPSQTRQSPSLQTVTPGPSTPESDEAPPAGVSLNSYVEELDRWLEPTTETRDIPENPYRR